MLLRRITKHVKDQNWFAVFLDFFIVVAGILIAFQITNWSEERSDRKLESRYINELVRDLENDSRDLQNIFESEQARVTAVNYIFQHALNETPPSKLDFPSGKFSTIERTSISLTANAVPPLKDTTSLWTTINFVRGVRANRSVFDTLVSTGDLRVMRDPKLIKDLQDYYSLFDGLINAETATFTTSSMATQGIGQRHGLSPFGASRQDVIFDLVRADPEFSAAVRGQREMAALHATLVLGLKTRADKMVSVLEERK